MKQTTATTALHPPAADWRKFAAAGAATLAAVSAADASIIYTKPSSPETAAMPGFHSGNAAKAFTVGGFNASVRVGTESSGVINIASAAGQLRWLATSGYVRKFSAGQNLTAASLRTNGPELCAGQTGFHGGHFLSGHTGFAGFRLPNGDAGWMRLEVIDRNGDGFPDAVQAIDWAYNDAAGGSITAGQGIPSAVPEPGADKALALLAVGGAGVLAWRKRRTPARTGNPAALTSPDAARILFP